eukprot:5751760-Prymnesium_polylepis.1
MCLCACVFVCGHALLVWFGRPSRDVEIGGARADVRACAPAAVAVPLTDARVYRDAARGNRGARIALAKTRTTQNSRTRVAFMALMERKRTSPRSSHGGPQGHLANAA